MLSPLHSIREEMCTILGMLQMRHIKGQETALKNKTLRFCGNTFSVRSIQKSKCRALDKKILLKGNHATVAYVSVAYPQLHYLRRCSASFSCTGHTRLQMERGRL